MKLRQIITNLALEVEGGVERRGIGKWRSKHAPETRKSPVHERGGSSDVKIHPIQPRNDLFWFKRPRLLLYLVHVMLFQNAFEFAFFFWALFTYGFNSCLVGKRWMIITRLILGILVQLLCSACTLPLYDLVNQLGSNIRVNHALSDGAVSAIHNWRDRAKKNHSEHTIDIELPSTNGHHEMSNGERNGIHPPQENSSTASHDNSPPCISRTW